MPYTRPWSDSTPPGSRNANEIDDAIREFKVDVHERMDDIVVDWTSDPIVLDIGGTFVNVKGLSYNDNLGGGNKVQFFNNPVAFISVQYQGTITSNARFTLNFNEVNVPTGENWSVNGGVNYIHGSGVINDDAFVQFRLVSTNGPANTMTFENRFVNDQTPSAGSTVVGTLLFTFVANPS